MTATAPAKVYFTNLRTHARESQLDKLKRLIRRAGIEQIDFENKFVAIKIHFGELGNLSFLRPNYARASPSSASICSPFSASLLSCIIFMV